LHRVAPKVIVNGVGADAIFLTAEWRHLAMLNYEVDAGLLDRFVPRGTEIDCWDGRVFLSLVGFRFLKTRVRGMAIPFHANFDEVNLRFYVRRKKVAEISRGVVFIREFVPRRAIAQVARTLYNENYVALSMSHEIEARDGKLAVSYRWRGADGLATMKVRVAGEPQAVREGSEEQFITEHYWGYAAQRDGTTVEYRVTHPSWRVWRAEQAEFSGDVDALYGREFAEVLLRPPSSAFLADGSVVAVMRGRRLGDV
jgi:uncharacterized protein YqjF (DUF2071 family)